MLPQLSILLEANQSALASLADKERTLADKEKALHAELEKIENERRALFTDRDILQKAHAIHERLLGGVGTVTVPSEAAPMPVAELKRGGGQARARIGTQRYAMFVALRDAGPITYEAIAAATGLSLSRVREQMRADQPIYVTPGPNAVGDPSLQRYMLTVVGLNLLTRFENYRHSQGKPLPKLSDPDDGADEDEAQPDSEESLEVAQTNEAAGEVSSPDAPTASVEDAKRGIFS